MRLRRSPKVSAGGGDTVYRLRRDQGTGENKLDADNRGGGRRYAGDAGTPGWTPQAGEQMSDATFNLIAGLLLGLGYLIVIMFIGA